MELTDVKRAAFMSGLTKASMFSPNVKICLVSFFKKNLDQLENEFNDAVRNDPEITGRNYLMAFRLMQTAAFDIKQVPGYDAIFVEYAKKFNFYAYTGESLQQAVMFIKFFAEYFDFEMTRERDDLLVKIYTPVLSEEDVYNLMDYVKKFVETFK